MKPVNELEGIVEDNTDNDYRSKGEWQIASTLRECGIEFRYEPRMRLELAGRAYDLRPDFVLTKLDIIVEYFGMVGKADYDKRSKLKQSIYRANQLQVLSVYPWDLVQNWPENFLNGMAALANRNDGKALYRQHAQDEEGELTLESAAGTAPFREPDGKPYAGYHG